MFLQLSAVITLQYMYCDMLHKCEAEYQSDAGSTKDTPYLTLTGELWSVFCEILWGTAL